MKYVTLKRGGIAAALCLAAAVPVMAQPTTTFQNSSFDQGANGLNHWQTFGDVLVLGSRQVSVGTTASVDFADDYPLDPGFRNLSGIPAVDLSVPPSMLAGIPVTSLDIGGFAAEGSAIRQDFVATGGGVVTIAFDWTFLTTEPSVANGGMPDFGFVALNGTVLSVVSTDAAFARGRFQHTFVDAPHLLTAFPSSTLYTPRAGGQVSLVLGVVDIGDFNNTSDLRIDNISVSAVPEPEAFAMLAAGLGLIGWKLRRRQQAQGRPAAA